MTKEEKAKAYDAALERAQKATQAGSDVAMDIVQYIFPELKESEDERIRKDIVSHFESIKAQALYDRQEESDSIVSSCNEKIAWLEKQKEQKPVEHWQYVGEVDLKGKGYFCDDNRFDIIDKAREDIVSKTNIESSPEEMKVLDNILYRAWQMGWLSKYDVIVPEQKPAVV